MRTGSGSKCEITFEDGSKVELGAKAVDVRVDAAGSHAVVYEQGGERHEVRGRWLCDAESFRVAHGAAG